MADGKKGERDRLAAEADLRRRQIRGLVWLVVGVVVASVLRAGVGRVFTPGWWRLW